MDSEKNPLTQTRPAYGLFPADDFLVTTGDAAGSLNPDILPQALWFFQTESIAVPRTGCSVAGFDPGVSALIDLGRWTASRPPGTARDYPALVWIGAPDRLAHARFDAAGEFLLTPEGALRYTLVARLASNRSYFNGDSREFLGRCALRVCGARTADSFVVHSVWPEDFRLDPDAPVQSLAATAEALRDYVRSKPPGAGGECATQVVWQRNREAMQQRAGRPLIGLLLNGAQGDDDEAHAGHFSLLTGRAGAQGEMHDWLVANYYTLESESEKGILSAMVPMQHFMADLNSGQAWYRPSWMLVATLRDERTAIHLSSALARMFNHYYRYPFAYHHAVANCTGICLSTLRTLGWQVPALGASSWWKACAALPVISLKNRSLAKGKAMFDYLTEDRSRLFPAVAFEQAGADLLRIVSGKATRSLSRFEELLGQDIEEIMLVRIPQLPSSRAWGDFPVASVDEYQRRLPEDSAKQKIIPVEPRRFPEHFRTVPAPDRRGLRSDYAVAVLVLAFVLACAGGVAYGVLASGHRVVAETAR